MKEDILGRRSLEKGLAVAKPREYLSTVRGRYMEKNV